MIFNAAAAAIDDDADWNIKFILSFSASFLLTLFTLLYGTKISIECTMTEMINNWTFLIRFFDDLWLFHSFLRFDDDESLGEALLRCQMKF